MKSRGSNVGQASVRSRTGQLRRSYVAAATVAPGAFLLGWAAMVEALGVATGLFVGWIPAGGFAAAAGAAAYVIVDQARRQIRTVAIMAVAIVFNVAYLAALWWYVLASQ